MKTFIHFCIVLAVALAVSGQTSAQQRRLHLVRDTAETAINEKEKRELENPAARAAWEVQRSRDPRTGLVPENIRSREYAFASKLPARTSGGRNGIQAMQWIPMGPNNVGGRTRALAFDINNTGVMLAGAVSGGMWRSTDDGESWTKVTLANELQGVSCVVQDQRPGKTHVWYYGTGELLSTTDRRVDTLRRTIATGHGIYKSGDNGATWTLLPSTNSGMQGVLQEHFQGVWDIATNTANTVEDEVYAACYGGVMRSLNGGATWELVLGSSAQKAFNTEIALTSAGVMYGAVGSLPSGSSSPQQGVWRSTNGVDWTNITPPDFPVRVRRTVVAIAPSDENTMYVLTETPLSASGTYDFSASRHSLWRYTYKSGDGSGNGGEWEELSSVIPGGPVSTDPAIGFNTLGGYCMVLAVHPQNPDVVYMGGTDLFRTTDGFASAFTVAKIGGYPATWAPDLLHPDLHAIAFYPGTPSSMCVGGDGGMTWSDDNLADSVLWRVANNGYVSSQFYSVAMDHAQENDAFIIGGLQDNGSFGTGNTNPDVPWELLLGGDGTGCAIANNQEMIYVSAQSGYLLQLVYNEIFGGYIYGGLWMPEPLTSNDFNFITLFALEPNETNIMYLAAKNRLWRHNDLANTPAFRGEWDPHWVEMADIGTEMSSIMAFGTSVQPAHRLYVGTHDGRVLRIDNANTDAYTSVEVTGEAFPQNAVVSSISVDPNDADIALISFSNYNVPSVFYTVNGGADWVDVSGNLEENPDGSGAGPSVRCVRIHRTGDRSFYFVGTSAGLFSTAELAGSQTLWEQEGPTVVGNVMVEAIDSRSVDGRVVVATQGNGVFAGSLPAVSVRGGNDISALLLEQNYPNPARHTTRIRFHVPVSMPVTMWLYNTVGERVLLAADGEFSAGEHSVDVPTESLVPGAYFYRLQAGKHVQTRKMTVVR